MKNIVWTKIGSSLRLGGFNWHKSEIGFVYMVCKPKIMYINNDTSRPEVVGWNYNVWIKGNFIHGKTVKSLDMAKSYAKTIAIKLLLDHGFEIVKELKEVGVLKEVLAKIGIDL